MASAVDLAHRIAPAQARADRSDTVGQSTWRTARLPSPLWVLALAVAAVLARLPFLTRPLSADEGGFLMVAGQWTPGSSLYGNYWVDRPPLLITLFQVADLAGDGRVGLRLLGATSVGLSVVLAAVLARVVGTSDPLPPDSPRYTPVLAAATAAVFLDSPLFGAIEVDGELLAIPFVLSGLIFLVQAHRRPPSASLIRWGAAGALAVAATAVKQDMLEGFVAAAVVLITTLRRHPARGVVAVIAFGCGAAVASVALLLWAGLHGTAPAALWDAIVTFRAEASTVIARSAPNTTHIRALRVLSAFLASGAVGLLGLAFAPVLPRRGARRPPHALHATCPSAPRLRGSEPSIVCALAAAILSWEMFAVAAGGSYWLHYLVGMVPGLVLASTHLGTKRARRRVGATAAVLLYSATVALAAALTGRMVAPTGQNASDVAVERYLASEAQPPDTAIVAFRDPALLQAAGLASPYPLLWSLPVRVRDPHLTQFTHVLTGPHRPTWIIVNGDSLATWGVDASLAQPVLDREYRLVHGDGDWHIYRVRTA